MRCGRKPQGCSHRVMTPISWYISLSWLLTSRCECRGLHVCNSMYLRGPSGQMHSHQKLPHLSNSCKPQGAMKLCIWLNSRMLKTHYIVLLNTHQDIMKQTWPTVSTVCVNKESIRLSCCRDELCLLKHWFQLTIFCSPTVGHIKCLCSCEPFLLNETVLVHGLACRELLCYDDRHNASTIQEVQKQKEYIIFF